MDTWEIHHLEKIAEAKEEEVVKCINFSHCSSVIPLWWHDIVASNSGWLCANCDMFGPEIIKDTKNVPLPE